MDKKGIIKAESRLRLAKKAASELSGAKTYEEFADAWYAFLVALKNIYTVLEQGAKASPQSRQWFGGKAAERRADELLQYLYEARNDDEHGLEPITTHQRPELRVGVAKEGFSSAMSISMIGGVISSTSFDGKPVLIERTPEAFLLNNIQPRGRPSTAPPTKHMGVALEDVSPRNVASLALTYMDTLVSEAAARAT